MATHMRNMELNKLKQMRKKFNGWFALSSLLCTCEPKQNVMLKADLFRGSRGMPGNICDDPLHVISGEQRK